MPIQPIYLVPGICKSTSEYAAGKPAAYVQGRVAAGRWVDGDKIRFVAGFPEKIGGWIKACGPTVGVPRAVRAWRTLDGNRLLVIATESHLYVFDGAILTDITPLRTIASGTLTSPFTTTIGSSTVAVADSSQSLQNGDWVYLSAESAVGGLTISGWYAVQSRTASGYQVTAAGQASSSATGGGTVAFEYPRVTLTDPFTTTAGSAVVTVQHANHGASTGDYVTFSGENSVGGLVVSGEYQLTVTGANSYTITSASAAAVNATGGGSVITTYDVTIQQAVYTSGSGFGVGGFGAGGFGSGANVYATFRSGWCVASYGSQMLAAPIGGTIYVYDPATGGRAYPLLNAPESCLGMLVTHERFVVALGVGGNALKLAWADQDNYTVWTSTPTNTANQGRALQGGNLFIGGLPVRDGVSLLFSDRTVFQMSYTGDNFVYQTLDVADNAGLIAPHAAVVFGENCYWMSDSNFWVWNGAPAPLPTDDIRDHVFQDLNRSYAMKCVAGTNRLKNEVWFFYPSASSSEVDSYVIYHIDQNCWSIGKMERTAWTDADLFPVPIGADGSGLVYYHETGVDADGAAMEASITAAPIDISNGAQNIDLFGFIPDFERQSGPLSLTINTRFYPEDEDAVDGPYTLAPDDSTPRIDLRSDGKMMGFELTSNALGGDFRLALVRVDAQPAAARR